MHGSSGGNGREKACLIVNTSECVGIGRFLGGAEHIYIYIRIYISYSFQLNRKHCVPSPT